MESMTEPEDISEDFGVENWRKSSKVLQELFSSPHRIAIFKLIDERPGLNNTEIASEVNASKGTVSKVLHRFEHWNLIRREDGVHLAPGGEYITHVFSEMVDNAAVIARLQPFLSQVSSFGATDISSVMEPLSDSKIIQSAPHSIKGPRDAYVDFIESSDSVREVVPRIIGVDTVFSNRLRKDDISVKVIISSELWTKLQRNQRDLGYFEQLMDAGMEVRISEKPFPDFTISISNERVMIYTMGDPPVAIESYDKDVWEWAHDTYEGYRTGSGSP